MGSFGETVGEIWRQEEKVSLRVYAYGTSPVVDSFARVIDATCKSIYIRPFLVIKHRSHRLVSIPFSSLMRERERQNNNQKNSSKKKETIERTNFRSIGTRTRAIPRDAPRNETKKERAQNVTTMASAAVASMDVDASTTTSGAGLRAYYKAKIEQLEVALRDKTQNLRRLEAQRNELNGKGAWVLRCSRAWVWVLGDARRGRATD